MIKPGIDLADVKGFPSSAADRLRETVSVTTAEEFVDLADRMEPELRSLLAVNGRTFRRLRKLARSVAKPVDFSRREEYHTGMDPPPGGRDTY